jgi:hypothetical protein
VDHVDQSLITQNEHTRVLVNLVFADGEDHDDGVTMAMIKSSNLEKKKEKKKAQGKGET